MSNDGEIQGVQLPWDGRPQVVVFLSEGGEVMVGGFNMNEEGYVELTIDEMVAMLDVATAKLKLTVIRAIKEEESKKGTIYVPE